jgi:hypothetical protein
MGPAYWTPYSAVAPILWPAYWTPHSAAAPISSMAFRHAFGRAYGVASSVSVAGCLVVVDRRQAVAPRTDRGSGLESVGRYGRSTTADGATRTGPDSCLKWVGGPGLSTPVDGATHTGPDSGLESVGGHGLSTSADRATRTGPDSGLASVGARRRSTPVDGATRTPVTVRRRTAKVQPAAVESLRRHMKEPSVSPER